MKSPLRHRSPRQRDGSVLILVIALLVLLALIGTAFIVWFLPNVGPRLMRVNLKEEARKLKAQISGGEQEDSDAPSAFQNFSARAYRVTIPDLVGVAAGADCVVTESRTGGATSTSIDAQPKRSTAPPTRAGPAKAPACQPTA